MLLQQIVETLDKELDKLHQIRAIVSSLESTAPDLLSAEIDLSEAISLPVPPALPAQPKKTEEAVARPVRKPKERAERPRAAARPRPSARPRPESALGGSIPKGPVVVPASALPRAQAGKTAPVVAPRARSAQPAAGSLGSMIRALGLDPKL